jgi:signal transduction histidine kinase/ligand-binding sensor domain-containing protein
MRLRGRAPGTLLAGMLLACTCAFALNPALDISQYAHTSWKVRDGFPKGEVEALAQTPDGYLWLGTEFGLVRFDGVRAVPWQPPADQSLPSNEIIHLLVTRDGALWIGTRNGLASWKAGKLTPYPAFAGRSVLALLEDGEGTVWASALGFGTPARLCAIRKDAAQCYGEDGSFGRGVYSIHVDRKGNLWLGEATGLRRWETGPPQFYPLRGTEANGVRSLAEDDNGQLLIAVRSGIKRLVNGKLEPAFAASGSAQFGAKRLLRDRDGGLWIGTQFGGLAHVHQARTDGFSLSDGLSGENVSALFEDREGNIWVATATGLDRFRDFAAATFSANQGLSNATGPVLATRDGSIWFITNDGLDRLDHGRLTLYREHAAPTRPGVRQIVGSGLPDHGVTSLFSDDRGRIWVVTLGGFGHLENDRFVPETAVPKGNIFSITQDAQRNLWLAHQDLGLLQLAGDSTYQQIPWAKLGGLVKTVAADLSRGGLWLGYLQTGGIAYFRDGQIRATYRASDGVSEGVVSDFLFDRDDTLWAATEGGLSRLKNGRAATLTSKNGLPCDSIHWLREDDGHALWLHMPCGLVRVDRAELDAWAADSKRTVKDTVFDSADGVSSYAVVGFYTPRASVSPDGKLWFYSRDGLSMIDPRHLPFNALPPPVRVEQITADGTIHPLTSEANNPLHLPARVRDLEIDYTALSLVAPEKMKFRYQLEGYDRDWQDAGNRRQAFYTNLPPRNYRFRVRASNNSGVWNDAGAFLDFAIAPAYYQTGWFQALCVAAVIVLLAACYQLRLQYLKRQFDMRMEERVGERTRIARDFHDTLLQSFQGVLLKLQAVGYLFPDRADEAPKTLAGVIEEARQAIIEGRDAVQGLRSSTVIANDLAKAIGQLGEQLIADQKGQPCPECRVEVQGKSRDLLPLVRDEVYRIAGEAVRNAFRHSRAGRIEVEIRYDQRELLLRVRDNGKGIDAKTLEAGGRAGHHGLPGMQERAKLAGGKLAVWSEPDSGTEIELTIPGSLAYAKSQTA